MNTDNAIKFLRKDENRFVCFLECIKRDNIKYFYAESDGVLLYDVTAGLYLFATENEEACERALKTIDESSGA